jgi:hypothetical protein
MTHIIRQQYVHVEIDGTEAEGLALQRRLPALCQQTLMPALERVLDQYLPTDRHLCIERLELDVGTMPLERLEHELADAAARALERSLREKIPPGTASTSAAFGTIQHKTDQQRIHDAFLYFLETGNLPWSCRVPNGTQLEHLILESWQQTVTSGLIALVATSAMRRLLGSSVVRKRLVLQFSPRFLSAFISLLSPGSEAVMAGLAERLGRSSALPVPARKLERVLWETCFANVASGKDVTSSDLVGEAVRTCSSEGVSHAELVHLLAQQWPETANKAPNDKLIRTEPISPLLRSSQNGTVEREHHPEVREGLYVENAGLVLVHPFLPQFFSALGIAEETRLLQPDRALSLLHCLATGQTVAPEYELVLPKILCDVPLGTPVESQVELTVAEQEESIALLEALLRHWGALRNSSPDGLRGAFLLRPGKVSLQDDGDWYLQIESRTHDILLDQLPWGLSMITLPWMGKMLRVAWK